MKAILILVVVLLAVGIANPRAVSAQDATPDASPVATIDSASLLEVAQIPSASSKVVGTLETIPCPFPPLDNATEGTTYFCAVYTVPQDYANPSAGALDMMVLVRKASTPHPLPDPLVFLAGGPGQSAIVQGMIDDGSNIAQDRDIIYPAVRGTLFSQRLDVSECLALLASSTPADQLVDVLTELLGAPNYDPGLSTDEFYAENAAFQGRANATCAAAVAAAGLDIRTFTTENTAHDLVNLLAALGYEEYNLRGTSYGTTLALRLVDAFPDAPVRSVILDSVVFPNVDRIPSLVRAPYEASLEPFNQCAADAACSQAFPDMRARALALIRSLSVRPLTDADGTVTAADVVSVLSNGSGSRPGFFPIMVYELEQGTTMTFRNLQRNRVGLLSPETPGATAKVQQFLGLILAYSVTPENPFAFADVFTSLSSVSSSDDRAAAIRDIIASSFDAADAADVNALVDTFSEDDLNGLFLVLNPGGDEPTSEKTFDAFPYLAQNSAFFLLNEITCAEAVRGETLDQALAVYDGIDEPRLALSPTQVATELSNCTDLPIPADSPATRAAINTDVPIMILQGALDTVIPLSNLSEADQFSDAQVVIVPTRGHNVWSRNTDCVGSIAIAFLNDPSSQADTSCLADLKYDFTLPVDDVGTPVTP